MPNGMCIVLVPIKFQVKLFHLTDGSLFRILLSPAILNVISYNQPSPKNIFNIHRFFWLHCDVIHQTQGRVFHEDSQTSRTGLKNEAQPSIFLTHFKMFELLMKFSFECLM